MAAFRADDSRRSSFSCKNCVWRGPLRGDVVRVARGRTDGSLKPLAVREAVLARAVAFDDPDLEVVYGRLRPAGKRDSAPVGRPGRRSTADKVVARRLVALRDRAPSAPVGVN